ncbi:MAG: glycoside hydrolase family 16 protein [Bacteroidales bacterium]|nr:glycoside hydrolase family 16 protein [Bacteroidales bacterium]
MKIRLFLPLFLFTILVQGCAGQDTIKKPNIIIPGPPQDLGWEFESEPSWADEFDYQGVPDPLKWSYDLGGHGWGNNELQYYTDRAENAFVDNGVLSITARKENFEQKEYTSARLVSKYKGDLLYGRVEVRAKIPAGRGTWPAIWMLPTDWEYGGWPSSGEIDIMEHVGFDPNRILITTHSEAYFWRIGTQRSASKIIENATTDFHLYRIDWTPYAIRGFIDNIQIFTSLNDGTGYKAWPFDKRFHLLLNLAIGGDWGGQQGVDNSIFPVSMEVDYVRFYPMIQK